MGGCCGLFIMVMLIEGDARRKVRKHRVEGVNMGMTAIFFYD